MRINMFYLGLIWASALVAWATQPAFFHQGYTDDSTYPEAYAKRTYFYAGGEYVNFTQPESKTTDQYMVGSIYVEKLVPHEVKYGTSLVFIAGNGQTGTVCHRHKVR